MKSKIQYLYLIDSITYSVFGYMLIMTWWFIEIAPDYFEELFGLFSASNGILLLITFYPYRKENFYKFILTKGCISICAGLLIFIWPMAIGEHYLILIIAIWLFLKGILHLYIPAKRKASILVKNWIHLSIGTLEFAFGVFLLFSLKNHSFPLFWSVAIFFSFMGIFLFIVFLRERKHLHDGEY